MGWKTALCLTVLLLAPAFGADLSIDPQYVRTMVNSSQRFALVANIDVMSTYTLKAEGAKVWENNTRTFIAGSGKREIPFYYTAQESGLKTLTFRLYDSDNSLLATTQAQIDAYIPYNSTPLFERISFLQGEVQPLYDRIPSSKKELREDVLFANDTLTQASAYFQSGDYVKAESLAYSAESTLNDVKGNAADLKFEFPELGFALLIIVLVAAIISAARFFFSKE